MKALKSAIKPQSTECDLVYVAGVKWPRTTKSPFFLDPCNSTLYIFCTIVKIQVYRRKLVLVKAGITEDSKQKTVLAKASENIQN